MNDLRFQWGRDLETAGAYSSGPSISMGAEIYGMPNALPRTAEPDEHRFQITDVFNKVYGRHTVKFGGDVNLVHEIMINLFQGGGVYGYSGTVTQEFQNWIADAFAGQPGNTDPYAGSHYNTFVQTIDQVNPTPKAGGDDFWMQMYDGFVEDSWKVNQKLTLNLGVRYDLQLTPDPALPNTSSALAAKYNTTIKNVADRVQPRIGFAWTPNPTTVVRGGYGIFTGLNQGSTYYAMRVENGVYQINYNYNGCNACTPTNGTPAKPAALQFPNVPFLPPGPALSEALFPDGGTAPTVTGVSAAASASFHGLSPDFVPPITHEFNLAIEQELPGKMSLSVGYVGTRALRLPVFLDANLVGQTPHGVRSFTITQPNGTKKLTTVPYYLATDRIDQTLTSINAGFSVANSWYNSMAVTLRRPFQNGLEVLVNYTWAKALDDDQVQGAFGTFYGGNPVLDPNNLRGEYGRSDIDMRERFVGTLLYKPTFKMENNFMRHVVNGFTFSGTATEATGFPIVASMTSPASVIRSTPAAADGNIYGGAMSSSSGAATTGRPPQIQRNSQPGPGTRNIDFRVTRDVPIHERVYMQFVGEAFNLMNHTIISSVNSSYSTQLAPTGNTGACQTVGVPTGSQFAGCIVPFVASTQRRRVWCDERHQQPAVWAASTADFSEVVFLITLKQDEGTADSAVPFFFERRKPGRIGWLCRLKQKPRQDDDEVRRMQRSVSFMVVALMGAVSAVSVAQQPERHWAIVVHGGAGVIEKSALGPNGDKAYRAGLDRAIHAGAAVLDKGGSAMDAVEAAIHVFEDDPLFNAGKGAVFTREGKNEMDASIMDGSNLKAGAVAGVTRPRHPISAATGGDGEVTARDDRGARGGRVCGERRAGDGAAQLLLYGEPVGGAGEAAQAGRQANSATACWSAA